MAIKKILFQNKVDTMLDSFMGHAREEKYWKILKNLSRKDQLNSMIKVMRGSILKKQPDVLEYSIKYVRKNW